MMVDTGVFAAAAKKLVHEDVFSLWANSHTHGGVMAGGSSTGTPDQNVVAGATGPDVELNNVTTQNVRGS